MQEALDLVARKTFAVIPISKETQRIAISNDDRYAFTSDQTAPRLAVIDTATNQVKTWVEMPGIGYGTAPTPEALDAHCRAVLAAFKCPRAYHLVAAFPRTASGKVQKFALRDGLYDGRQEVIPQEASIPSETGGDLP